MADEEFGYNPSKPSSPNDGYTRRALAEASEIAKEEDLARSSAMDALRQAFYNSQEVTPTQGIAAALLAAIPTFGGYMIGKSVGKTEVPQGVYNINPDKLAPTGAYVGGAAGTKIGQEAASGYLKNVLEENKSENAVFEKNYEEEMNRALSLEKKANAYEEAAFDFERDKAMMPLELEQYRQEQDIQLKRQKELADYQNTVGGNELPPELLAVVARELGVPEGTQMTASQLNAVTGAIEANRREKGQDIRLKGENLTPPSPDTKKQVEASLKMKALTSRYSNAIEQLKAKDPGAVGRTIQSVLPQTEIGKLQLDLAQYAVAYRNAREPGIMTQEDYQRALDYVTIRPTDTFESVQKRMQELMQVTDIELKSTLIAKKAGQENVSEYEKLLGYDAPSTLSEASRPQDPFGVTFNLPAANMQGAPSGLKQQKLSEIDAKIAAIEAQLGGN